MRRPIILLTLVNFIALGAGFLREVTTAYNFGTTAATDAFSVTLFYLETVTVVVMQGFAGYGLVPVATRLLAGQRRQDVFRLLEALLWWSGLAGLTLVIVSLAWPNWLASIVAPNFSPLQHSLLARLLMWGMPAAALLVLSGIMSGVLQATGDYYAPVYGNVLFNLGIAGLLLLGATGWGIVAGGVGLLLGALAQLALQVLALTRQGWRPAWPHPWQSELRPALVAGLPTLLAFVLIGFVLGGGQRWLASGLPEGSLASVNYAQRTMGLVSGITLSLATVSLTELSVEFNAQGMDRTTLEVLGNSLKSGLFLIVPAASILFLSSEPLIALLFKRGHYDATSVSLTVACLRWFAVGLIPGVLVAILHRACAAFQRPWRATMISLIWTGATIGATALALPRLGAAGMPAAYVIGMLVACVTCFAVLWDLLGKAFIGDVTAYWGRTMAYSGLAIILTLGVQMFLPRPEHGNWSWLASLGFIAATTAAFGLAYLAASVVGREPQLGLLLVRLSARLGHRSAVGRPSPWP